MADNASQEYPARLSVEYPDGPRDRLSVFVRILLAIPILIIGALVTGSSQFGQADQGWDSAVPKRWWARSGCSWRRR